ncbi:hypothetical protein PoB_000969600 [Plakobranchus ocellatus]|uniref:Uncharacterized protein n=1 Tax=Plakobranchus ocellatus TaxID=259542 RepID=A0AAV3YIX1_9GAST|nr:hypothetical protein PoB_000969600 [Plakobranchus ocellatus]
MISSFQVSFRPGPRWRGSNLRQKSTAYLRTDSLATVPTTSGRTERRKIEKESGREMGRIRWQRNLIRWEKTRDQWTAVLYKRICGRY